MFRVGRSVSSSAASSPAMTIHVDCATPVISIGI